MTKPDLPTILPIEKMFVPPEGMVFFKVAAPAPLEILRTTEEDDVSDLLAKPAEEFSVEDIQRLEVAEAATKRPKALEAQFLPVRKFTTTDGRPLSVTMEDIAIVLLDWQQRKTPVPMLYEHGAGPRGGLAAGWNDVPRAHSLTDKTRQGLFTTVEWTARASKEIKAKEWGFLSPGFFGTWDEEGFLHPRIMVEGSLTNVPAIDDMMRVAASVRIPTDPTVPTSGSIQVAASKTPKENETMTEEAVKALVAAEMKTRDEEIAKLRTENGALTTHVSALKAEVDKVPEATRQAAETAAKKREDEHELGSLIARATKVGLATKDTEESFKKLAGANFAATKTMVERAEAVARTPRGGLFHPDSPAQAAASEPVGNSREAYSQALTAAIRLSRLTGQKVQRTIREVTQ